MAGQANKQTKTAIEEHANYTDIIKREKANSRLFETFTLNPKNLYILTDKPNKQTLSDLKNDQTTKELGKELKDKLASVNATPKMKFVYPMTSN